MNFYNRFGQGCQSVHFLTPNIVPILIIVAFWLPHAGCDRPEEALALAGASLLF